MEVTSKMPTLSDPQISTVDDLELDISDPFESGFVIQATNPNPKPTPPPTTCTGCNPPPTTDPHGCNIGL